jgi:PAS domain-containing protein
LRLVQGAPRSEPIEWTWFCGYCAAPAPEGAVPPPVSRVCRSCGLGLLLETRQDTAPSQHDAFLVIDSSLLVQALSRQAQSLLGLTEEEAVNRPVIELLTPADAETQGPPRFAAALAGAAASDDLGTAFVRPWNTFGVRMRARVAPCGPPRAALVVLEDMAKRPLRAVS